VGTRPFGRPGDDLIRATREAPHAWAVNTPRVDYKPSEHPVRVDLGRGWSRAEGTGRLVNIPCLNGSR